MAANTTDTALPHYAYTGHGARVPALLGDR